MPGIYRDTDHSASGFPIHIFPTLSLMREIERTPYGQRLFTARREHAKISQKALAAATGASQSNISELELAGQGSSYTPQIAARLGVRASWLATGEGPMLERPETAQTQARLGHAAQEASPTEYGLGTAVQTLARALEAADQATREDVLGMLTLFVRNPIANAGLAPLIVSRLSGEPQGHNGHRSPKQA